MPMLEGPPIRIHSHMGVFPFLLMVVLGGFLEGNQKETTQDRVHHLEATHIFHF